MNTNKYYGKIGEEIACKWLIGNKYRILERNFRYSIQNEIDIICIKDKTLYFVEVRSITNIHYNPLDTINPNKINRIKNGAKTYMYQKDQYEKYAQLIMLIGVRIDLSHNKAVINIFIF